MKSERLLSAKLKNYKNHTLQKRMSYEIHHIKAKV